MKMRNRVGLDRLSFEMAMAAADAIAAYSLEGIVDKQGMPLIDHVRRVAEKCECMGLSDEQRIAAILHDCIEDTEIVDYNMIELLFGTVVADIVNSLTRVEGETYLAYVTRLARNPLALQVKQADWADNLDELRGEFPGRDKLRQRYISAIAYVECLEEARKALGA